jgi:hypothetical protein
MMLMPERDVCIDKYLSGMSTQNFSPGAYEIVPYRKGSIHHSSASNMMCKGSPYHFPPSRGNVKRLHPLSNATPSKRSAPSKGRMIERP